MDGNVVVERLPLFQYVKIVPVHGTWVHVLYSTSMVRIIKNKKEEKERGRETK